MIKDLRKKKAELENLVIQLKSEIKEQDEDLMDLTNELNAKNMKLEEYTNLINDERSKNYKLQKKIKELSKKLPSLDGYIADNEQYKNNNINILNNNNNYLNIYANPNINEIISNSVLQDNFNIIKCIHVPFNNRQFKWYIFQKINKEKRRNSIALSMKNYKLNNQNEINEDDIIYGDFNDDISYSDFIFIPERNTKELSNFNLPLSDSYEKEKIINDLELNLKKLENKYKKKEKDFNVLNINFSKLLYKNKSSNQSQDKLINTIDRLRNENQYLNQRLMKYTNQNKFIGVSFIANDEEDNHYLDDKCFEDILDELDNRTSKNSININLNKNNFLGYNNSTQRHSYKNINVNNAYLQNQLDVSDKYFYSSATKFYPNIYKGVNQTEGNTDSRMKDNYFIKGLKDSFKILMAQIEPSKNAKVTIVSILKQLGYNDNEIMKVLGNNRGVISMHSSNSKFKK